MWMLLREPFSVNRLPFWTGLLASSLIGGTLYMVTQRSIEQDAEERFTNHARQAQSIISMRIKSYSDLLRSTGSVLKSADGVTSRQFHDYVNNLRLKEHFPAIAALNYGVYVTQDKRAAFDAYLDDAVSDVLQRRVHVSIKPGGVRPAYLVTTFVEPPLPETYGIDLMTIPGITAQIMESRDRGKLQASGTPIAALSGPNNVHLGIRMPIYRHGAAVSTVEERRAAFIGSLGVAFSLPKLLQGVLDETPVPGMRMTLVDKGPRADAGPRLPGFRPLVLFDSQGDSSHPTPLLAGGPEVFSTTLPLEFISRSWETVYSVPKSQLYTDLDVNSPRMMMAFGFIGSMLLYALLQTLTSSRRAALRIAEEMTRELRESQYKLQVSHQKLRRLADHAYQVKEFERKRIAREIHDDLGQNMLALRIEAEILAERTKRSHGRLHERARSTLLQIDTTIKSIRQIINDLRPTVLDLGLNAAVEWQVKEFRRRTGIVCNVKTDGQDIAVADHCATAFFRILQESLTNIVRHANATEVTVELGVNDGWLTLSVRDNGCGLPAGGRAKTGSFGLVGIEERIFILGGTCAVHSEPGRGTTVKVSVPINGVAVHISMPQHELEDGSAVV
jgi:signal transduction histidine kinase/CHASE1-domain containing sensor protein